MSEALDRLADCLGCESAILDPDDAPNLAAAILREFPAFDASSETLEALSKLQELAARVLADINDQQTGWYYQFSSAEERARNVIRKAKQ